MSLDGERACASLSGHWPRSRSPPLPSHPAPAKAADLDFTLVNRTGYEISQVFVGRESTRNWGRDILGRGTLGDAQKLDITFPDTTKSCTWDLKVVYSDDDSTAVWHNLNLCDISKVTVHYNRRTGETTAKTE